MKRSKLWLTISLFLVLLGAVIFTVAMTVANWDFSALGGQYETTTHTVGEDVNGISVKSISADIRLLPAKDGVCRVVCTEEEHLTHTVTVKDGILSIEVLDERSWTDHLLGFTKDEITVYLPKTEYGTLSIDSDTSDIEISNSFSFSSLKIAVSTGDVTSGASVSGDVKITTSTGDIRLQKLSANAITIETTTGEITLTEIAATGAITCTLSSGDLTLVGVTCDSLSTTASTGEAELDTVTVNNMLRIERSTGDVTVEKSDAAEIVIKTSTGDVEGRFLTDKVFIAKSSSGDIDVPRTVTGGRCEITTSTGDIEFEAP